MGDKKAKGRGFFITRAHDDDELGREFINDPKKFLTARGMTFSDLACPPAAHEAMARGEAFEAAAQKANVKTDAASIEKLKALASEHFGADYVTSVIPFGLRFRERMRPIGGGVGAGLTATGSGSVTFLDTDGDVDD